MARSRNIKPGFFTNDKLGELEPTTRLLFAGLWTLCDREGRVEDRPKKIRAEAMPYDLFDADAALQSLADAGFILRYEVDGKRLIQVLAWHKHQNPHCKESPSSLPAPCKPGASPVQAPCDTPPSPALARLIPDSLYLIPDSLNSARAEMGDPPGFEREDRTPAGHVFHVMRKAGIDDANPADPRLQALLAQGATVDEFAAVAADAVRKGKGFAWALVALEGRRKDAQAISLAPVAVKSANSVALKRETDAFMAEQRERDRLLADPNEKARIAEVMARRGIKAVA